ncbi:spidroin-2-like [Elephas maximus indicus]|uniref:spidroin-2-like n=1 Tax=Elephas maximus indicus TaxID=99487 RepID=UPI002115F1EB|nr:spidroin-2-like [Elephas maximus indicus]
MPHRVTKGCTQASKPARQRKMRWGKSPQEAGSKGVGASSGGRTGAGGRCVAPVARPATSLPPAVECAGSGCRTRTSQAGPRGRRAATASPGSAAAAESQARPPPAGVCLGVCVRPWNQPAARGSGRGPAAERPGEGGPTDGRPRTLAPADPGPLRVAGRAKQRRGGGEAGVAVSARTRSLTDTHTHGPRHRHTTRTEPRPGAPSQQGAAHTHRARTHTHAAGPQQQCGVAARPGSGGEGEGEDLSEELLPPQLGQDLRPHCRLRWLLLLAVRTSLGPTPGTEACWAQGAPLPSDIWNQGTDGSLPSSPRLLAPPSLVLQLQSPVALPEVLSPEPEEEKEEEEEKNSELPEPGHLPGRRRGTKLGSRLWAPPAQVRLQHPVGSTLEGHQWLALAVPTSPGAPK